MFNATHFGYDYFHAFKHYIIAFKLFCMNLGANVQPSCIVTNLTDKLAVRVVQFRDRVEIIVNHDGWLSGFVNLDSLTNRLVYIGILEFLSFGYPFVAFADAVCNDILAVHFKVAMAFTNGDNLTFILKDKARTVQE